MVTERNSLLKKLIGYGNSNAYPFHMPGHKRRDLPGGFPDPYSIDITEIDGFDNLHHPENLLKDSMEWAAGVYGADKTYYLVNGSTCGVMSGICGTVRPGGSIFMARNSHKSAYHALALGGIRPVYAYPDYLADWEINGGIRPETVREALEREKGKIQAVFVVSPTYEGIVSDIGAIAKTAHEYGIPLVVDEAHGAHLPFRDPAGKFPKSALDCGADIVVQSLHKTLPSFTQTAVLHVKKEFVDIERVEWYLDMFQSTSPSYLFLASIERCILYMDGEGRREMGRYERMLDLFYRETEALRVLRVMAPSVCEEASVFGWDPSKIVISTKDARELNGEMLGELLRKRYGLEMEMCAPEYVIGMTSLMDTEEGFKRLLQALREIDGELTPNEKKGRENGVQSVRTIGSALVELTPGEALDREGESVFLLEAAGRISREFVYVYPPGIPVLAPGERVSAEVLKVIEGWKAAGLLVQGLRDPAGEMICVVREQK